MQLRELQNAPQVLYYLGELRKISYDRSVAIVGSRNPSDSAILETLNLTAQLVEAGFTIVSGLDNGIDTTAHLGAISAGGETVAVVGLDLLSICPVDGRQLVTQISQNGMILSDFFSIIGPLFLPLASISLSTNSIIAIGASSPYPVSYTHLTLPTNREV